MNSADALCDTLWAAGIDNRFAYPSTSATHFVAVLDCKPRLRCVLGLFEGTVTSAIDGYADMAGRPVATLLQLRPNLANRLINLHSLKRGQSAGTELVCTSCRWARLVVERVISNNHDACTVHLPHGSVAYVDRRG